MARKKQKRDTSYLQTPEVRRKRLLGIRRAIRERKAAARLESKRIRQERIQSKPIVDHLREANLIAHQMVGGQHELRKVSLNSTEGRLNVLTARLLIKQVNDLLQSVQ